jgi:glucose-6-phosphate isomerase
MATAYPETNIGGYEAEVQVTLARLGNADVTGRIWRKDHTVWRPKPTEITNRLGWLTIAGSMLEQVGGLDSFAREIRDVGFGHVVLLGMGGSSLGALLLERVLGGGKGYPELIVLDSTLPESVKAVSDAINPELSLFLIASKSGTTTEPMILYAYFREIVEKAVGRAKAGEHFVAITDDGTPLVTLARKDDFRRLFLNPPDIGGRFSVLSYFGLVPAALTGVKLATLLESAERMRVVCAGQLPPPENPGAWLGACLGTMALRGRDKMTLVTSPPLASFGLWVEQLIAESTGKEGKGIIPVANEPLMPPSYYGSDRLFVCLRLKDEPDPATDAAVGDLVASGQPAVVLEMSNRYDLGAEIFRWELATAVASAIVGVQPFDQPDVQKAKDATARLLEELSGGGHLLKLETTGSLAELLSHADKDRYLAIMVYLRQTKETDEALAELRREVGKRYHLATTVGYGPRYLHSTGQLYKGGRNTGLFLQLTANHEEELPIPGKHYTFGAVADAQALGDFQALQAVGRRVVSVHLPRSEASLIRNLVSLKEGE